VKLYPPVRSVRHQKWGITKRIDTPTWDDVFKYGVSQDFGHVGQLQYQYEKWGLKGHNGVDIVIYSGDSIHASHDGIVKIQPIDSEGGVGVDIWNKEGYKTRYWHLLNVVAEDGQEVKQGDLIAYGDNTGFSTGSHLHWGFKLTNTKGQTINLDNGYYGSIDPKPYLTDEIMELTRKQVEKIYVIAGLGLGDTDAIDWWQGKELDQLLNARLADLQRELDEL